MSERLKQIWSAYEAKTTRRLTGRGVDNIVAPGRANAGAPMPLPADYVAPAQAAFAALKKELAGREKASARPDNSGAGSRTSLGRSFGDSFGEIGEDEPIAAMLRGLASTERRVDRPPLDYATFAADNADRKLRSLGARKKFLGIF